MYAVALTTVGNSTIRASIAVGKNHYGKSKYGIIDDVCVHGHSWQRSVLYECFLLSLVSFTITLSVVLYS